MVYCPKCGTNNEEAAEYCVKCGAPLKAETPRRKRDDTCFGGREGRPEDECFGIPHGGAVVAIVFGLLIIVAGLSMVLNLDLGRYAGAFVVVVIGMLIIVGALFGLGRRKS